MEGEVIAFKPDDFGREQDKVQVRRIRASDKFFAAAPYFTWPVLRRVPRPAEALVDPLDVEYDGVRLRTLLEGDEFNRRETSAHWRAKPMTTAQRAAVSAHWSAALCARVAASDDAERNLVRVDLQDEP